MLIARELLHSQCAPELAGEAIAENLHSDLLWSAFGGPVAEPTSLQQFQSAVRHQTHERLACLTRVHGRANRTMV